MISVGVALALLAAPIAAAPAAAEDLPSDVAESSSPAEAVVATEPVAPEAAPEEAPEPEPVPVPAPEPDPEPQPDPEQVPAPEPEPESEPAPAPSPSAEETSGTTAPAPTLSTRNILRTMALEEADDPRAPSNVTAEPSTLYGNPSILVNWSAPAAFPELQYFRIDYAIAGSGNWTTYANYASWSSTSRHIEGLSGGTLYDVRVGSFANWGDEPFWVYRYEVLAGAAPTAPTELQATPGAQTVDLEWVAPSRTGASPIERYEVLARTADWSWFWIVDVGTGTSASINPATLDAPAPAGYASLMFSVRAVNATHAGDFSAVVTSAPTRVPLAVGSPNAVAGDELVSLSWSAPNNSGSAITGYAIEYRDSIDSVWVATASTGTTTTITGLSNRIEYEFRVAATNANGTGEWSPIATATPVGELPGTVTGLTATSHDSSATLGWTPVDDAESYYVEVRAPGEEYFLAWEEVASATSTLSGLDNGSEYEFRVAAVNDNGQGAYSDVATATPFGAPGAVHDFTASPFDGGANISWQAPLDNGGAEVTSYSVAIFEFGGEKVQDLSGTPPMTVDGLVNGSQYEVYVRPVNGSETEALLELAGVFTAGVSPSVVAITSLRPHSTTIDVEWSAPEFAGASPVEAFEVRWAPTASIGLDSSVSLGQGSSIWMSDVVDGLSLTITELDNSIPYTVQVRAINAQTSGPWSDAIDGTPFMFEPTFERLDGTDVAGTTVRGGELVVISGSQSLPGERVFVELHSTPIDLGSGVVAADGSFTVVVRIPTDAAAGSHELYAYMGSSGGLIADADVTVTIAQAAASTDPDLLSPVAGLQPAATSGGSLAVTGVGESELMSGFAAALLLLLAGVALMAMKRRRVAQG